MRTHLALPTDPAESFVREVDDNLRRDQARDFLKKNGPWLVGAVLLFLAGIAGWLYWQDRQQKQAAAETEKLNTVMGEIGTGQVAGAETQLATLAKSGAEGVSASARLTSAALALQTSDRKTATDQYRSVMDDKGLAQPYRDLATVRLTALEFDQMKPADVIARLKPLAVAGNPWFGSAGEMFAAIAADDKAPETIRSRAVQIAGTLGIDATASLPATARQD